MVNWQLSKQDSHWPVSHDHIAGHVSTHRGDVIYLEAIRWLVKVVEHSFGSLWVYVICQIMARERLQLTSWNLASENYTDERFWLTGKTWRCRSFHGNMNDWIQP